MRTTRGLSGGPSGGLLGCVIAGATIGAAASGADATWSILIADLRTGEVAAASATCLTSIDLRHETPVLITGVGGATAQSFVDQTGRNRRLIRDLLLAGVDPQQILVELESFDASHQTRQYGIIDVVGGAATFSGAQNGQWAGGQTGRVGDLVYAVQGNVLAGAPVVQAAVDAIRMTPGDVPEKLMAGMEAAFLFGGDGRCSCETGGPEDCGSPPNDGDFEKSAHVAYMLIARAGDTDGCNAIYDTRGVPTGWIVEDFNQDGRLDAVCSTTAAGDNVSLLLNTTDEFAPLTSLAIAGEFDTGLSGPQAIAGGDFNADGVTDVAVSSLFEDSVSVLLGTGGGSFAPGMVFPVGDGPRDIVAADLNGAGGLDLAVVNALGVSVMLGAGDGTFTVTEAPTLLSGGVSIVAGNFDGAGGVDLAIAHEGLGAVTLLLGSGAGGFIPGGFTLVGAGPVDLAASDLDGDGLDDLVTANETARSISVLLNTGGAFARTDLAAANNSIPARVSFGDLDGNAHTDMIVLTSGARTISSYSGDGAGGFSFNGAFPMAVGVRGLAVGDFSGDGLGDVLAGATEVGGAMLADNQGDGAFLVEEGCAAGEYFMTFNIANASANDPDPVLQLRGMFDQWRGDLTGRPDAVQSRVTGPTNVIVPESGDSEARLRLAVRDWRRVPVSLGVGAIGVEHAPRSDAAATIVGVEKVGDNLFDIVLRTNGAPGHDELVVTVDDGAGPVRVMPNAAIDLLDADADFDADGSAGYADILAFLAAFVAQDPAADLDGDTMFTIADVMMFTALYRP